MSKRDLISEIQAKKLRFPEHYPAPFRLFYLQQGFTQSEVAGHPQAPIHSLFLVGIVACIEVAVRDAIRRLIDHGSPYIDRISDFKDVLRLDVNIGRALQDRRISFGDLVSHLLPASNMEQINSHFTYLFARDFRAVLADVREFVEPSESALFGDGENDETDVEDVDSYNSESSLLPIADVDTLIASLGRLFRARHNIAHEADFESILADDVRGFFRTAEVFIHALDEIVIQILEPNKPRSAPGMALFSAIEAGKVYSDMQSLETKLVSILSDRQKKALSGEDNDSALSAFKAAQEAFEKYLDLEIAFDLARVGMISGNGIRMLESQALKEFCEFRIQRLKQAINFAETSWVDADSYETS